VQAIAELLAGLLVDLYRKFQQSWLGRARLREAAPAPPKRLRGPSLHNRGTGHSAVVLLSNSARSVDALGLRILERINGERLAGAHARAH
jgi:hypothetical protein